MFDVLSMPLCLDSGSMFQIKIDLSLVSSVHIQTMNFINKFTCTPPQLGRMITKLRAQNTPPIIDYVRESSNYDNFNEIKDKICTYPCNTFAIKLSTLGVDVSENKCASQLESLIHYATQMDSTIMIDAEQHDIQDRIEALTDYYMQVSNTEKVVVYKTYQMYKKGANERLMEDLSGKRDYKLGVKLVRGAYVYQDKRLGVLCKNEQETHQQYDQGILDFVSHGTFEDKLLCATHNARSVYLARYSIDHHDLKNIEFAQLLGMCDYMTKDLQSRGYKTYKYLPYGEFRESVPYLLRRVYENYPMIRYLY